ncbi:MAG: nucleotidyltransferase [Bacteroidetes bacterium CG23_combo_of_CG06-09_8_20_14_all_32_9]|nr:MAG: nucleotidyltransferase [Bacteroidetes bacterium CG23_combo_of_CG06-09_8_20_14_all_32_9]
MKIIIPMAGLGKRMRPHTLTVPKPLIPIAGKPIVQRLVEDIAKVLSEPVEEIAYVIGDFGKEVEESLCSIASDRGITSRVYYQLQPLGTAHAILCAAPSLSGKVIVAFADTLFRANFKLENNCDGVIWVRQVADPSDFGVVKLDKDGVITDFIEKPKTFVSDLAIIGIYYFNNGQNLKNELQYLVDKNIVVNGEYQLTDALQNIKNKGMKLRTSQVEEWFDCGNKEATLQTTKRILELSPPDELILPDAEIVNSIIIPPCFVGHHARIENSILGPFVSVGKHTTIKNSIVSDSIIQRYSYIENIIIHNSIVGNHTEFHGNSSEVNIGDYTSLYR